MEQTASQGLLHKGQGSKLVFCFLSERSLLLADNETELNVTKDRRKQSKGHFRMEIQ